MVKVPVIVKIANYYGKIYVIRKMILSYGFYQDFRAIYVHLIKRKAWLFLNLNVCKVLESTTNWGVWYMNFMGKKHAVNWLLFTKSILKRKMDMSVLNLWGYPCGIFGLEESLKLKCFDHE